MGTRGAYGFRVNGRDMIAYNQFDSYLDGLGRDVLGIARKLSELKAVDLKKKVESLNQIGSKPPTKKDIKALEKYTDLSVSEQSTSDWYCLTRKMQGDIAAHIESGYFPKDSSSFLADSLFCEWAYIINVDDMTLEVYMGFNKDPKAAGRYAKLREKVKRGQPEPEYCGVKLVKTYKLSELPENFDALEKELNPEEVEA